MPLGHQDCLQLAPGWKASVSHKVAHPPSVGTEQGAKVAATLTARGGESRAPRAAYGCAVALVATRGCAGGAVCRQ